MDQKPHSRQKTVSSGSAGVNKGQKVSSRPVGGGSRPSGGGQRPAQGGGGPRRTSGGRAVGGLPINPKLIVLIAIIVVAVLLLKSCAGGGMMSDMSGYDSSSQGYPSSDYSSSAYDYSGYDTSALTNDAYTSQSSFPAANTEQANLNVASAARAKRVTPVGNGQDKVTIMVYMCGTDLESKYGMATSDLNEMLKADLSDKVNLIVETGGCKQWKNKVVSNSVNQIYKVEDDGLRTLESNIGSAPMTDPKNLSDFIRYCKQNFPADRYALIFWDHGGGSLSGYGYDEKNPNASSMTLAGIDTALKNGGCVFDWIGFDACLMATLETDLVCEKYADYMIASEETEPGTGWQYTGWLTALSRNTSIPTVEMARILIDDFVSASTASSRSAQVTLSVTDLAELNGTVPPAFKSFASSTNALLQSDSYTQVSNARAGVRQFAQSSKLNQVDLIDLANRIGTNESKALADALSGCVKYNRATMSRCYGVSIYFPYETTKSVKNAVASYQQLGIDDEYTKCIQSFASLEYGGQIASSASQYPSMSGGSDLLGQLLSAYSSSGSSTSPVDVLTGGFSGSSGQSSAGMGMDPSAIFSLLSGFSGRSMPQSEDWVDTELIAKQAQLLSESSIDPSRLTVTDKNGKKVLSLTEDEWALIQTVELNVFVEDDDGYIDLGLDNTFEFDGDDLLLDHDGTWLTLDGHVCAYYLVSDTEQDDGSWKTVGRIPARLNGQFVNLQVVFDEENPEGIVTGAYPLYENNESDLLPKGDIAISAGDTIELLCDYYELDGSYSASYTLGESFTVGQNGMKLTNMKLDVDDDDLTVTYRLTDIYDNHFWIALD